jgi:hypothetical protein
MISDVVRLRLETAGIQLVAETDSHFLFTRENCIALVERRGGEAGPIGSTGMMTPHGLAYLVWRDGLAYLKSKSAESPAGDSEVAAIRRFSQDLESALR